MQEFLKKIAETYDVVHIHNVHSIISVWSGLQLLNKGFSGRLVVTPYYHGAGHTPVRNLLWKPWRYYVRRLLNSSHAIHTVSKKEAELIRRDFRREAIPIENGVEEQIQALKWDPQPYVMYSGRIEKYKNVHRLAKIVKLLNDKGGYYLELRIYGNGPPYKKKLEKELREIPPIKWYIQDFQPYESYIKTLSKATLFALISEKESYPPQSVNEANAIGVPPTLIAKPWGTNFNDRTRTLIINLNETNEEIAEKTTKFLKEAPQQPKSQVPTWTQVVNKYIKVLYT